MARITALRPDPSGKSVLVELDGRPWRVLPDEVVVRAGLESEVELGRAELRRVRSELRRFDALDQAARSLRFRDHSRQALSERLEAAGIAPAARTDAIAALEQAGIVDDERVARSRAAALAERGSGDELIRADLQAGGIEDELIAAVLAELEPERKRARGVVDQRGRTLATARWLARRGFADETIEAVLPEVVASDG